MAEKKDLEWLIEIKVKPKCKEGWKVRGAIILTPIDGSAKPDDVQAKVEHITRQTRMMVVGQRLIKIE